MRQSCGLHGGGRWAPSAQSSTTLAPSWASDQAVTASTQAVHPSDTVTPRGRMIAAAKRCLIVRVSCLRHSAPRPIRVRSDRDCIHDKLSYRTGLQEVDTVLRLRSGCDSINAGCTSTGHCDATWSDDSSGQKMSDRTGLLFTAQCSASDPRPIRPRLHPRQAVLSHGSAGRRHCASPPIRL